jgi:MYXO-CTERM domain-containing protein
VLLLAAVCAAGGCSAATEDELRARSAAVTNGTLDTGDAHVVALRDRQATCGQPAIPGCTGVVVAPRVIATAAHCVEDSGAAGTEVFFGSDVEEGGDTVYVEEVLMHPGWDSATRDNDIALVLLRAPAQVEPAPLLAAMDAGFAGTAVRVVGFGSAEAGLTPGVKRSGTAEIASIEAGTFRIAPSPAMSCQGDSGGPVFVTVADTEYLAGITSRGDIDCAEFGVNTRIDVHIDDFIGPYLDAVDANPATPDAGPSRSNAIDVCSELCAGDEDCPPDTTCSLQSGELRCGVASLPYGFFSGQACAGDCDCADGICAAIDRAGRPECACYTTCEPQSGAPDCDPPGGCGCSTTPAHGRSSVAWLVLLLAIALRRRHRAREPNTQDEVSRAPGSPGGSPRPGAMPNNG